MKRGWITNLSVGRYGRMCNGMFQIAAVLGIGKKENLEPCFEPWINHDHRDRFGSTEDCDLQKYFVHALPSIPEGTQFLADNYVHWGFHDVRLAAGNHNLSGHFQSHKYFADCRDQVHHYFRMHDEPELNDYCAVHWRAGDYSTEVGYHPRMPMSYYQKAFEFFPSTQRYLVFSDSIAEAKLMFGNSPPFEYSENRDYIQDFKLMKRCRSFVIANSSYSAMAATLGESPDKIVVAPRPWFGPVAGLSGDDIYEPSWKLVQWS